MMNSMANIWIGALLIIVGIIAIVFAFKMTYTSPSPGAPKLKGLVGGVICLLIGIMLILGYGNWK